MQRCRAAPLQMKADGLLRCFAAPAILQNSHSSPAPFGRVAYMLILLPFGCMSPSESKLSDELLYPHSAFIKKLPVKPAAFLFMVL